MDGARAEYAGRAAAASPATGSAKRHASEQEALLNAALGAASPTTEEAAEDTTVHSAPNPT